MKRQSGFTLIELVVVITILAILAATALPRFVSIQVDARISKLNAVLGSVQSASALVHSRILTRGGVADTAVCPGTAITANNAVAGAGTVCTENGIVNTFNGYPASSAIGTAGIISAAGLTGVFNPTLPQLNNAGYGAVVAAGVTTFSVTGGSGTTGAPGAQVNNTCSFTYTQAVLNAAPVVSVTTVTGC